MKKFGLFLLIVTSFAIQAQAQSHPGDLTFGAKGAYMFKYKGLMYGLDISYQVSPLLEASLSGLINPKIHTKDSDFNDASFERNVSLYSGNLDLRFLLVNSELMATGPSLGVQCSKFTIKDNDDFTWDDGTAWGFNIGWHLRVALTENVKINGGWRYTNATEDQSHHIVYLGIGYSFSLF